MNDKKQINEENYELINAIKTLKENLTKDLQFRQVWVNEIKTCIMNTFNEGWKRDGVEILSEKSAKLFIKKLTKKTI